jgi:hypothetical protein
VGWRDDKGRVALPWRVVWRTQGVFHYLGWAAKPMTTLSKNAFGKVR